ncbi:MAG: hypothetical protein U5N55_13495 [Cypionkella sp.]|nr:hypothetical protein [Cypionkella sp.]
MTSSRTQVPTGQTLVTVPRGRAIIGRLSGKILAKGKPRSKTAKLEHGWTGSPGHHANNINPAFEDFGLARAGSGADRYWVLVLGKD